MPLTEPAYQKNGTAVHLGDCRAILTGLPAESVHCCVTSPPYWGLRNYGVEGQLGVEETPEAYVEKMVDIFQEVRRVLRDDATLWLNLGDSYANDTKWGGSTGGKHVSALHGKSGVGRQKVRTGLKAKDLIGIPWRVALALQADGWYLRSDIIWNKPNPMPESVTDRPTKAHEYVFLMSKSKTYYYDADAIKMPLAESTVGRPPADFGGAKGRAAAAAISPGDPRYRGGPNGTQWGNAFDYQISCPDGRNKRSVWTIATQPFPQAHFAVFPEALPEICIKAGCPQGGVVLDPFAGAGTTLKVARDLGCKGIGIELNPEYIEIIKGRMEQQVLDFENA